MSSQARGLQNFISDLRNAKSKDEEIKRVEKELANIRKKFTAGGPAKVRLAKAHGFTHVIDYTKKDFQKEVMRLTKKQGVPVVYDAVGKNVYEGNLRCLAPRGWYVNFGHASGFLPPIDAMELNKKSLIFTKASLKDYNRTPQDNARMTEEVLEAIANGVISANISREYKLDEIAQAHIDIAGRATTGVVVLTFD